MIGWDEVAHATLLPADRRAALASRRVDHAAARRPKVILSPANKIYLDMKYDDGTLLGLHWAGNVDVRDAYDWDPGDASCRACRSASILGVEAPIWSETLGDDAATSSSWRSRGSPRSRRSRGRRRAPAHVGRVPRPPRRAGAALDGARDQRLLVAEDRLAALARTPRSMQFVVSGFSRTSRQVRLKADATGGPSEGGRYEDARTALVHPRT